MLTTSLNLLLVSDAPLPQPILRLNRFQLLVESSSDILQFSGTPDVPQFSDAVNR